MSRTTQPRPVGHVLLPAAAIGSLSILLVAGLDLLGILARADLVVSGLMSQGKSGAFPRSLPDWSVWLATVFFAFGLACAVLNVPGTWRRWILWITALVLVAGWAPVLSLAARAPEIGAPLIATLWSGICALVYAGNHQMPCDEPAETTPPANAS